MMFSTNRVIFSPPTHSLFFPFGAEKLGITICEDSWNDKSFWPQRLYDRDPISEIVGKGSTLLLNISSSPYTSTSGRFATTCSKPSPRNIVSRSSM